MDLKCEGKEGVGLETLQWIHTYKTAALLKAAVCCGATLAGATEEDLKRCETYALKIGLAFQVNINFILYIYTPKHPNPLFSFVYPLLAGATEEDLKRCETYALKIGLAFQVRWI